MIKTVVSTERAPKAVGPYSQAIKAGSLLFLSGQIPLDPRTGEIVGDEIKLQTKQVLENIKTILASVGATMPEIVKTTVFLKDMEHFAAMNQVYQEYFKAEPPARSTVQVARLPKDVLVEIECIATVRE